MGSIQDGLSAHAGTLSIMSQLLLPEQIKYLVVHCSASKDDEDMTASDIHQMHLGFGWHGIGYHRVIRRSGDLEMARPEYWCGAHVYGFNDQSLGVCLIGCNTFTEAQYKTLEATLREWRERYPAALICGHCDFSYTEKTCPNFDVAEWCAQQAIVSEPLVS